MPSQILSGDKKVSFPELAGFAGRVLQRYGLELMPTGPDCGAIMAGREQVGFLTFQYTNYPNSGTRAEFQVYSGLPKSKEYDWGRITREIKLEWPKSQ